MYPIVYNRLHFVKNSITFTILYNTNIKVLRKIHDMFMLSG